MSIRALAWAFDQEIFPSSHKFVLVALANHCSDKGKSYPGVKTICDLTSQKEKTVRRALQALVDSGIIVDTGKRTGETSQVKVYQLPKATLERPPKRGVFKIDEPELEEYGERPPQDPTKTPQRWSNSTSPNTIEPVTITSTPPTPSVNGNHSLSLFESVKDTLSDLYKRPRTDPLSCLVQNSLVELCRRPNVNVELELVVKYRSKIPERDRQFFPQSFRRLIESWEDVVDRARAFKEPKAF